MLFVCTLLATVSGNLLLKAATMRHQGDALPVLFGDVLVWLGLLLFGLGAVFYLAVLSEVPLNVAQSFLVAQFVGVILGAHFILHESLPWLRIVGISLICIGILLVALSQS